MNVDKKNSLFTVIFAVIICVFVIGVVSLLIGGLYVIANEEKLYAKELNNPYVNSNFDNWHTEVAKGTLITLPEEWKTIEEGDFLQIYQEKECVATGAVINEDKSSLLSKESFLSEVLGIVVTKVDYEYLHSLLGSSFGKVLIEGHTDVQIYYLNLSNNDGTELFFCFLSADQDEKELKNKAEAIIYAHEYCSSDEES